jgi:hypothetical protein
MGVLDLVREFMGRHKVASGAEAATHPDLAGNVSERRVFWALGKLSESGELTVSKEPRGEGGRMVNTFRWVERNSERAKVVIEDDGPDLKVLDAARFCERKAQDAERAAREAEREVRFWRIMIAMVQEYGGAA